MPNYQELYKTLFSEVTRAITALQNAQLACEEAFMAEEDLPPEDATPQP